LEVAAMRAGISRRGFAKRLAVARRAAQAVWFEGERPPEKRAGYIINKARARQTRGDARRKVGGNPRGRFVKKGGRRTNLPPQEWVDAGWPPGDGVLVRIDPSIIREEVA
jgi:hypothetical protein